MKMMIQVLRKKFVIRHLQITLFLYVFECLCSFAKNTLDVIFPSDVKYMSLFLVFIKYTWNPHVNFGEYGYMFSYGTLKHATISGVMIKLFISQKSMATNQSEQTLAKNNVRMAVLMMP